MKEVSLQDEGSVAKIKGKVVEWMQLQGRRCGREGNKEDKSDVCVCYVYSWTLFVYFFPLIFCNF